MRDFSSKMQQMIYFTSKMQWIVRKNAAEWKTKTYWNKSHLHVGNSESGVLNICKIVFVTKRDYDMGLKFARFPLVPTGSRCEDCETVLSTLHTLNKLHLRAWKLRYFPLISWRNMESASFPGYDIANNSNFDEFLWKCPLLPWQWTIAQQPRRQLCNSCKEFAISLRSGDNMSAALAAIDHVYRLAFARFVVISDLKHALLAIQWLGVWKSCYTFPQIACRWREVFNFHLIHLLLRFFSFP